MSEIEYIAGNASMLDRIEQLWEELNDHHVSISKHFSKDFSEFSFEVRKASLIKDSTDGDLQVLVARNKNLNKDIGYCISNVNSENKGEIESIYVKPNYRNTGIGRTLMEKAIEWLDSKNVVEKVVGVAYGNESTYSFYAEFGFFPRMTVLRQKSV